MISGPAFAIGALIGLALFGRHEQAKDYSGLFGGKDPFASPWSGAQQNGREGCC